MTSQTTHRAIIRIVATGKNLSTINYSRRMYAIMRRYTSEAVEGTANECFAELTGLRTFFKMTYSELADTIRKELTKEIGISFSVHITSVKEFEMVRASSKKSKQISTYKEINSLFAGKSFVKRADRQSLRATIKQKKIRLVVPFLGKVA